MRFSNFDGGHLGVFPKGLGYDFGAKYEISSSLYVVKLDLEMMFAMFQMFLQSGYPSFGVLVPPNVEANLYNRINWS